MSDKNSGMTGGWARDEAAARAFRRWRLARQGAGAVQHEAFLAGYAAAHEDAGKPVGWFGHSHGCPCGGCRHARMNWS